jgi:signal transduction histidine kinase
VSSAPRPTALAVSFGKPITTGTWLGLRVTNQAEPIPTNDLLHIFDRFYRGDKSRRHTEGSGLGLAIVRETVLAHGGRIEVSSDAEQGTCFQVWLPVAVAT